MIFRKLASLLALVAVGEAAQPSAPAPIAAPLRELPWAQLNFLHTTDTHGWHGGHLQEASYSGDWGDYISFAHHLRQMADDKGVDLLLIDTGDRVEGNGLYDASEPKGKYTFDIFKHQQIDVICAGNHELYKANSSENEFNQTIPNFKGNYLASNIDIVNPTTGKFEPLAKRWRKFTTKTQGIRVVAFGFLYNFQGNYNNTRVQPVQETIKEKWFQDAIRTKDTDLFLVAGHVAVRSEEYDAIYNAIRQVQWDTPIQFFGGHTHIRDYKKYDSKAVAIESGRYMETIGFMSISGLSSSGKNSSASPLASPVFARRYIDNNLYSYYHHSNTTKSNFDTELGVNVTKAITDARSTLGLDTVRGCAPQDYWVNRAPADSPASIFPWLGNQVIPDQMKDEDGNTTRLVISNTGAIRFDIFKGPFTKDSESLVSPFTSGFRYLKDVDFDAASRIIDILNHGGPILRDMDPTRDPSIMLAPEQRTIGANIVSSQSQTSQVGTMQDGQAVLADTPNIVPGYTTTDDAGNDGDDTIHAPVPFFATPNCIASAVGFDGSPGAPKPPKVDVVYNEFIETWILQTLRFLGKEYTQADTARFMDGISLTQVISGWVQENWACSDAEEL